MYRIIGSDQREYGPVSADQVREWIVQGRANGATLAQPEGATDWQPLSSLPEFGSALAAQPAPTPPPPLSEPGASPWAPVDPMEAPPLDIGRCLSRSWNLYKENFGLLIGGTIVVLVLIVIVNQIIALFTRGMAESLMAGRFEVGAILTLLLWNIPEMALSGILMGGFYVLQLKLIRGQTASIGDVFAGFGPSALRLALAGIVVQLLTVLGFLACIVPGVYLSTAWILTGPLIVDRGMGVWEAMELSRKVVTKRFWIMFCIVLIVAVSSLIGLLACCVGLLVTVPVGLGAFLYAYEDLFGTAPRT